MLIEGVDYNFNSEGLIVFTKEYHLKRGYCCKSGCLNCPWNYTGNEKRRTKQNFEKDIIK